MDNIPQEICNQIISDKLNAYAYIINIETYEVVYMTRLLATQLHAEGRGIGRKCYEVVYSETAPCAHCPKNIILQDKPHRSHQHDPITNQHFTNVDYLLEYNNKQYLVHTTVDVTEEIKTINSLQKDVNTTDTIISCASVLINHHEPSTSIRALLKILSDFYDAEFAYLFERDYFADKSNCTYFHRSERCPLTPEDFEFSFSISGSKEWVTYMKGRQYAFTRPGQETDAFFPIKNHPISIGDNENCLFTPLDLNGITAGTICIANLRKNIGNFAPVTKITAFIVNSLSLKYSEKNLQKTVSALKNRNALNQTLLECAQTLILGQEIKDALTSLLKIICHYFNASYTYILERDLSDQTINPTYWYWQKEGPSTKTRKASFLAFEEWFDRYQKNGIIYIEHLEDMQADDKDSFEYNFLEKRALQSFAMAPLHGKNEKLGFLWVENPKENIEDLSLLNTICVFVVNHISKDMLMKKFEHLSFTDKLTNLYNRNFYINYLEKMQKENHTCLGTIYADVNGLKIANDKLGHEYGDMLLKWCGKFFANLPKTTAFRVGGDEFICFVEHISKDDFESFMEDIHHRLRKIGDMHVSIGSVWIENANTVEECVHEADKRMYEAKQKYYCERANSTQSEEERIYNFKQSILRLDSF